MNFPDAASLTDSPGREVRICALDKEDGDTLRYEFKFAADPEPEKVRKQKKIINKFSRMRFLL